MNTELWQNIGAIADSESLMRRLAKYAAKLVKEKQDSTLMSKEEYFAKIERAEQQIANGEGMEMLPGEDLTTFLRRNGYHV
jgi:anthranilate/para-aminobenzoate synthase component I